MRLVFGAAVGVMGVGVWAASELVSGTPAFNATLRSETVYGDWRTLSGNDMYYPGMYLFQLGYTRVTADTLFSADTEGFGELADIETALLRAEEAVDLLKQSVAQDPGNAHAWGVLASAAAMAGDVEGARAALAVSWELAPNNAQLAGNRTSLIASLTSPLDPIGLNLTEEEVIALTRDVTMLQSIGSRGLLTTLAGFSPVVAEVVASTTPEPAAPES